MRGVGICRPWIGQGEGSGRLCLNSICIAGLLGRRPRQATPLSPHESAPRDDPASKVHAFTPSCMTLLCFGGQGEAEEELAPSEQESTDIHGAQGARGSAEPMATTRRQTTPSATTVCGAGALVNRSRNTCSARSATSATSQRLWAWTPLGMDANGPSSDLVRHRRLCSLVPAVRREVDRRLAPALGQGLLAKTTSGNVVLRDDVLALRLRELRRIGESENGLVPPPWVKMATEPPCFRNTRRYPRAIRVLKTPLLVYWCRSGTARAHALGPRKKPSCWAPNVQRFDT